MYCANQATVCNNCSSHGRTITIIKLIRRYSIYSSTLQLNIFNENLNFLTSSVLLLLWPVASCFHLTFYGRTPKENVKSLNKYAIPISFQETQIATKLTIPN